MRLESAEYSALVRRADVEPFVQRQIQAKLHSLPISSRVQL